MPAFILPPQGRNANLPPTSPKETPMLWMILFGLVAGAIAKAIMPGKDPGGIIITILLGIGGSIVGGMLFGALGMSGGRGLVGSVIGALILLWAYRQLKKG